MTSLALNQWHHVAVTRQGDDVTVYLDGQVEIPTFFMPPAEGTQWTNGVWGLGGRVDQAYRQQRFVGNLDEISIYRGALDPSVIQANYASATAPAGITRSRSCRTNRRFTGGSMRCSRQSARTLRRTPVETATTLPIIGR